MLNKPAHRYLAWKTVSSPITAMPVIIPAVAKTSYL